MESVEKSKNPVGVMGNFVPTRMWMKLDGLWGKIWGNGFPQFVHPQSTGGVDKILAEKSHRSSPARESRGTAFLWSVQVKPGRARRLETLFLNPGVRPGIQLSCRSVFYLYNIRRPAAGCGMQNQSSRLVLMSALSAQGELRVCGRAENQILVDSGLWPGIKRGFRVLRDTT